MRGLKELRASPEGAKFDVMVGDDLYNWQLTMPSVTFLDDAPALFGDLEKFAAEYSKAPAIELKLHFPKDFPTSPPFVRVVRPRFQFHTVGWSWSHVLVTMVTPCSVPRCLASMCEGLFVSACILTTWVVVRVWL
jgi:hypothetical protein